MEALKELDYELEAVDRINNEMVVVDQGAFDINVMNKLSGSKTRLYVTADNTLGQVMEYTAGTLGLDRKKINSIFVNERTGLTSSDSGMSLREFDVLPDTLVSICQDSKVAAFTFKAR
ncbi:MAG: hypothetical protein K5770_13720 [Lachnospiraceae bacterium]|nr:hypothetical protein [Lachnospiraceae bacterium]